MATGDQTFPAAGRLIEVDCSRQFSRAGGNPDHLGLEVSVELSCNRRAALIARVASRFVLGKVGTVEMHTCNATTSVIRTFALHRPAGVNHRHYLVEFTSGGRWKNRGGAVPCVCSADGSDRLDCPIHEISPCTAMDVDVDKTRRNVSSPGIQRMCICGDSATRFHRDDPTSVDDDHRVIQESIRKNGCAIVDNRFQGKLLHVCRNSTFPHGERFAHH